MNDLEQRAHDLAIMYIKSEIELGKMQLPKTDEITQFVGHYDAIYLDFLDGIDFFFKHPK